MTTHDARIARANLLASDHLTSAPLLNFYACLLYTSLRGHSNIQGATDMAGLFDSLPGYLKIPSVDDKDFDAWMKRTTPTASKPAEWESFNYYSNTPKFAVSLLKALYGPAAKKENNWAFDYLPKIDREYSCLLYTSRCV